jgi:hypothetical protein
MNGNAALTNKQSSVADVAKKKDLFAALHGKGKAKVSLTTRLLGIATYSAGLTSVGLYLTAPHVCMEATGPYSESSLVTALRVDGWKVSGC